MDISHWVLVLTLVVNSNVSMQVVPGFRSYADCLRAELVWLQAHRDTPPTATWPGRYNTTAICIEQKQGKQ
jgi:hypothetical protein